MRETVEILRFLFACIHDLHIVVEVISEQRKFGARLLVEILFNGNVHVDRLFGLEVGISFKKPAIAKRRLLIQGRLVHFPVMIKFGNAARRKTRADICFDAKIGTHLVSRADGGREIHAKMAVVRIAKGRNQQKLLACLPAIHQICAVIMQRRIVNHPFRRNLGRIGRIGRIGTNIEPRYFTPSLSRHFDSRAFAAFFMIISTECHIVVIPCHDSHGGFDDTIFPVQVIKIGMLVRQMRIQGACIKINVRIILRPISAHAEIRTIRLLLPVDAVIPAPSILLRVHREHRAKRRILLQILIEAVCRKAQRLPLAERAFHACAHRHALAIVLHRRTITIVEERRRPALADGEIHIDAFAHIAR